MSDNLFDYTPTQDWNGNVANVGMPTVDGNSKVTEIIINSNDGLDATIKCQELSLTNEYFQAAASEPVLKLVRSFFEGQGTSSAINIIAAFTQIQSPYRIQAWFNEPDLPAELVDEMRPNPDNLFIAGTNISYSEYLLLERTPPPSLGMGVTDYRYAYVSTDTWTSSGIGRCYINIVVAYDASMKTVDYDLRLQSTPLPAPTNVQASDSDIWAPGVVGLSWTAVPDALSYNVYRSTDATAFDTFKFDPQNLTSDQTLMINTTNEFYTDTTLTNIGTYYYWVAALGTTLSGEVIVGLLSPGYQCSIEHSCSDSSFSTEATCTDVTKKCIEIVSEVERKTRRLSQPDTWIPAYSNSSRCNPNINTPRCAYSSNANTWNAYSSIDGTEEGCIGLTGSRAAQYPTLYWVWEVPDTNIWKDAPNGVWQWNYSPETCSNFQHQWNPSLVGEAGSVAGDIYIEKAKNIAASEGQYDQISLSWTSNPTVDPLIGDCAECHTSNGTNVHSIGFENQCLAAGSCTNSSYNNNKSGCESHGYCSNPSYSNRSSCRAVRCSNTYWTNESSCLAAGWCNYSSYDHNKSGCESHGSCYITYTWGIGNYTKQNLTQQQCDDEDGFLETGSHWTPYQFTSYSYTWRRQHSWTWYSFSSYNYQWSVYPQWSDAPTCVTNGSLWVPDVTVQNTPSSYSIYRSTVSEHNASPQETSFVATVPHAGAATSTQTYIDLSSKDRFSLYYYKVTQTAGGVEGDFSASDSGWENS